MGRKIYWTDFSAAEYANIDPMTTIAIVPIAAVEQHGPHLPVGTDMILNQGCLDLLVAARAGRHSISASCRSSRWASPTSISGPGGR